MKKSLLIIIIILLSTGVVTAAVLTLFPYEPKKPPRAVETGATEEGIKEVIKANNQFAFDLYRQLIKSEKENIFYSPYSLFSALAMTYEGAKGKTAEEIKSVFHFPNSEVLRSNFAAIYNKLNRETKDYELRTGNALWTQKDFPFLKDYLERVEKYYGGKAANLDFIFEKEKSIQTINDFIAAQTNDKIKDLISPNLVDQLTRLILTNAIYFKGIWQWQFDSKQIFDDNFEITPQNIVKVPMMRLKPEKITFNYAEFDDLKILELPYKGNKLSMLILLPKDNLEKIESSLTVDKLDEYKSQLKETKLDLIALPKFETKTIYRLESILANLGMPTAFNGNLADFTGMYNKEKNRENLFINFVIHQAYVKVNEEGTEAAAATGVGMGITAVPPRYQFIVNRPFIFLIQEKDTGNILFLGKIVDPRK